MKKLLFSVAILAVAASCSQNEVVDMPQTNQIGFSSLRDRVVSKAANDTNSDFRVFAAKGAATAWFIDDYVTTYADAAEAPVAGPYYWPTDNSKMAFFAYAPYSASDCNVTEVDADETGTISLSYTVPSEAQEDFTVAKPVAYDPAAATPVAYPTNGVVDFEFQHMLSKVTVAVVLDPDFAKNNKISEDTSLGDAPFTATFTALKNTVTVDAIDGVAELAADATTVGTDLAYADKTSYYIAPQAFAGCKVQINGITIRNTNTGTEMFGDRDLKAITLDGTELGATDAAFVAGKHYIFTVTIYGGDEIKFTATSATWTAAGDENIGLDQE